MEKRQLVDTLFLLMSDALADLHTATIARVTKVGDTTIDCQPVINRKVEGESKPLPVFADVPPIFLNGGSSYLAHPIAVGDYALLLFTERCFDRWYNGEDEQTPLELRMHDYSDGFALVGLRPLAGAVTIPSETTMTGVTRMGVEDPQDFMALAGLVLGELVKVKEDFEAMKLAYDGHKHGPSPLPDTPMPDPHDPGSVASAYVKAE